MEICVIGDEVLHFDPLTLLVTIFCEITLSVSLLISLAVSLSYLMVLVEMLANH